MKSLWMIVILSAAKYQCDGQEDESLKKFSYEVEGFPRSQDSHDFEIRLSKHDVEEEKAFTLVYSLKRKVFQVRSNRPSEFKELRLFDHRVTGLTKDGDYVFVSTRYGEIWRVNVTNSGVDPNSWKIIVNLNDHDDNITCVSAANGQLYVGLRTGKILHCSMSNGYECGDFADFSPLAIEAIDYDPVDDWIYASMDGLPYRCPSNVDEPCTEFTINQEINYVTALKSGFDSLWMGTKRGDSPERTWLYKRQTRSDSAEGSYPAFYEEFFGDSRIDDNYEISSVYITDQYVYFGFAYGEDIWRCQPKSNAALTCDRIISNLPMMKYFVIV